MKKRILSVVIIFALIVISAYLLAECESPEPTTINVGFNNGRNFRNGSGVFLCGAKSDTVIFDLNDIKIDFYFGHAVVLLSSLANPNPTPQTYDWYVPEGYERISIAAIFYWYEDESTTLVGEYTDYRNIENCYVIKEFPAEEFMTEQYAATYKSRGLFSGTTTFNYYETITVPKELLYKEEGSCYFYLADVCYSAESNKYIFRDMMFGSYNGIELGYKKISADKIKIHAW